MAYLTDLIQNSQLDAQQSMFVNQSWIGKPEGMAYASFYPEWEVRTPQYVTPNPYALAQAGFRTNELVYTCINVRADSIAEAPLSVWDTRKDPQEEVKTYKALEVLANPCPGVSEQTFWKIVETYLGIAGFSAWEMERKNIGDPLRLWPMRPDWCSFLRGQQKPIRAVRYQPYGLPFMDIPIEDVLLFAYFDPLYPLLKPFSPTMNALEMVNTDNNMTNMINNFIVNGAFLGGVLSTENQVLQEAEAETYKRRWRESHGGAKNAGDIAVLGKGLKFQTTNNTFRDMVFPDVDARSEARICMTFRVPPMLIGAKIGLDRSTYSNYEEARKGFYEGPITSEWRFLSGILTDQFVTAFGDDPKVYVCNFDTNQVKALQEDRTAKVQRADQMYKGKWATKNEARAEAELDPVDDGDDFAADTPNPLLPPKVDENGKPVEGEDGKQSPENVKTEKENVKTQERQDLEDAEEKKYRSFAKRRIKEGKVDDLPLYEFKYIDPDRQAELIRVAMGETVISRLNTVLESV